MDEDDADYLGGSDNEDYGFDYSDGDEADDSASADVENMYYKAKGASLNFKNLPFVNCIGSKEGRQPRGCTQRIQGNR